MDSGIGGMLCVVDAGDCGGGGVIGVGVAVGGDDLAVVP